MVPAHARVPVPQIADREPSSHAPPGDDRELHASPRGDGVGGRLRGL
jgi:hypothetical protein